MWKKRIISVGMCALLATVSVHSSANSVINPVMMKVLNGASAIGSLASLAYWTREFSKIKDKAHDEQTEEQTLVIASRLLFDAFCASAFLSNTYNFDIIFFGFVGSATYLIGWLPEVLVELYEMNDPIYKNVYIAIGVIDILQTVAFYKKLVLLMGPLMMHFKNNFFQ